MKTLSKATIRVGIVLISIVALWGSAKAQTLEHKVTAKIPFDFSVGGKKFAAAGARTGRAFAKSRREQELERQQQVAAKTNPVTNRGNGNGLSVIRTTHTDFKEAICLGFPAIQTAAEIEAIRWRSGHVA